jgi:hypothetical protein
MPVFGSFPYSEDKTLKAADGTELAYNIGLTFRAIGRHSEPKVATLLALEGMVGQVAGLSGDGAINFTTSIECIKPGEFATTVTGVAVKILG